MIQILYSEDTQQYHRDEHLQPGALLSVLTQARLPRLAPQCWTARCTIMQRGRSETECKKVLQVFKINASLLPTLSAILATTISNHHESIQSSMNLTFNYNMHLVRWLPPERGGLGRILNEVVSHGGAAPRWCRSDAASQLLNREQGPRGA